MGKVIRISYLLERRARRQGKNIKYCDCTNELTTPRAHRVNKCEGCIRNAITLYYQGRIKSEGAKKLIKSLIDEEMKEITYNN